MDAIHCELLTHDRSREMAQLVAQCFSADEPLGAAVGLPASALEGFLSSFAANLVGSGLTVVAIDSASGRMAGALVTDDFASPVPVAVETLDARFFPIFSLLESLDEQ